MFKLNSFEKNIDSTILKRGKDYFSQGSVRKMVEIRKDEFRAYVDGSEVYTIEIGLKDGEITHTSCTCPYDFGGVCKHVVAGLFELRKRFSDDGVVEENIPMEEEVKRIIQKIDITTLQDIVLHQALKDDVFRNVILRFTQREKGGLTKAHYTQEIRDCIESYSGRYGYIEWKNAGDAVSVAEDFLTEVTDDVDGGDHKEAFMKIQAILETLYPALQEVDDSDGDVGSIIENTWFEFRRLAKVLPNELKQEVFNFCLSSGESEVYSGWMVESNFYDIASEIIQNDQMKDELLSKLQKFLEKEKDDFGVERIIRIEQKILEKYGDVRELEELLSKNIHIPEIRMDFIEKAIAKNDFTEGEKLAKEGIRIAEKKGHPGTVDNFQKKLLAIATLSKDEKKEKYWALKLFESRNEFEYFKLLKQLYNKDPSSWIQTRNEIIQNVTKAPYHSNTLYKIFQEEAMWPEFSERIETELNRLNAWNIPSDSGGLWLLDSYFSIIWEHFPEKVGIWYIESARRAFQIASTRGNYRSNLTFVKRLSNAPLGNSTLEEIRNELQEKYQNRKALLEEIEVIL